MSLSIRTNIASLNAQRNLSTTQTALESSMSRLSSGYRITRAGDDAAGLAISTKLEAQIRSYNQAARNANDGLSVIQTTEAALNETSNVLSRLRELAMQAASDGIGDTERGYVQAEADQLRAEIDRIAAVTKYDGTPLLDGTGSALGFQVGVESDASGDDRIGFSTLDATASALGLDASTLDFTTATGARDALSTLDAAMETISRSRADLGAVGNRFQSTIANIQSFAEALSAANSRIRDADVAEETSRLARANILQQAGVAVLAQANQTPQLALKLLGG
ncbi:flagellin domain protein [Anaeromyxobacter sp. K]|uniref:flagellin N-terminal helical domain-containing protein n=1 Tax=Anaeromyxobacter sp. (strain K) TaxID=447217 RepID=UPI00015F9FFD|nr:flagellin [Anaeromyxobacter sp. K]ACG73744.1 flagellin domain protein [Anaeromyxobacter sp. K]